MPHDFPQRLAISEFRRCWLSIIGTRLIPVAGTSWERTAVLGAARSDCGVASATMGQCIHSLPPSMKCLCCTYCTISLVPTYPFYCTIGERTCFSQRLNRATRLRERTRQAHINTIATIGSYVCACQLGCSICQRYCVSVESD